MKRRKIQIFLIALTASLLPHTAGAHDADQAAAQAEPDHPVVQFLKDGKVNLNMRLRYEYADVAGLDTSNALTLRTFLGYTTKRFNGFQGMVEFEDTRAADDDRYFNGIAPNVNGLSPITDPEDTNLNRLWIDYDFSELSEDIPVSMRLGRQRLNLDDQRFIGTVAWRQFDQTYDAVRVNATLLDDLTATYAYIDEVKRIFGDDSGLDFDSDSHIINVAYSGLEGIKLVGFAYLLDLGPTGSAGAGVSSQTYGVRLEGDADLSEDLGLGYTASIAAQSDYGSNATSYDAYYVLAESKLKFKQTEGGYVGAGFEMLGSDDGVAAFSTPLATLHKFNGFADSFLATPAAGLRDYYVKAGTQVPGIDAKLGVAYHYYTADDTSADLGQEFNLALSKKIDEHFSVLLKYANYDGDSGRSDIERFWLQIDFNF